jgi:hypothetical protein
MRVGVSGVFSAADEMLAVETAEAEVIAELTHASLRSEDRALLVEVCKLLLS